MKIFTPKNGFIRMTRQYVGGAFAGFGLCAITMKILVRAQGAQVVETPLLVIGAFLLVAIGGSLALSEQRHLDAGRKP
jgi:hypothetical protein